MSAAMASVYALFMRIRFGSRRMSLRDRLRGIKPTMRPADETVAAQALAGKRGRQPIAPPPNAGRAAARILKPLIPTGSMGFSELRRRWADIVGAPFAGKTSPEKLAGGVLTLTAPSALAPFLQQQTPLLIERLRLAGAKISSVRIEQRSRPPLPGNLRPLRRKPSADEEAALEQELDRVADAGLKSALLRLGRAVRQG